MTGRNVEYAIPPRDTVRRRTPRPCSRSTGSRCAGSFSDVSFEVRAGEVVGLAGLVGSGRTEILETVFGARKATAGTVQVGGKQLRAGSVSDAVDRRHRPVPRGAQEPGPDPRRARLPQHHALDLRAQRQRVVPRRGRRAHASAREQIEALDVRPSDPDRSARTLSGGNQQKVLLARWLVHGCRVLLLDEPTRGVDVGARAEIYGLIADLAAQGAAVVVVSSDIPEVIGLSDRVLVISEGRVVHEGPASGIDEHRVLDLVMEGSAA